ncbi:sodium:solute symporter family protein [Acanthopleuribacter pedis]|uniref:Sodium:solute symporter family protein n=1 Tax=Acanthopleuribacter pedis TaxID=442870 RepID=A0A8J7Q859_9BACT|nr:sodium:solute symporter family protein [Acanthopleuribacter pedis]MBO1319179.1 sodium:solute symporter family protein [Acanthopleuribacter pedis]
MIIAMLMGYLLVVLGIGMWSHRKLANTGEDFFVAGRTIGPFVLLMSLFGTHMTAFALLGASGEAYRKGIGVFGLMASSSALVVPALFFFVGTRVWQVGKTHGYLTQIQFFRDRWQADHLGLLLFVVLVGLLVPYLLIGVMGAGLTFEQITGGQIPYWVGSLTVSVVILLYVSSSGMRGTAMVNTFQTLVFMALGGLATFVILNKLGGLTAVLDQLDQNAPNLTVRGEGISPTLLITYSCIPLSAGMFPHLFNHWLTARGVNTFKGPIIFYPLCIALVWVPSVLLGMAGAVDFPGLQGPAANGVLIMMVEKHAPGVLGGLLAAGVFAAIMSSLDSQTLSIGNMFTQDIVRHYRIGGEVDESRQVWWGRLFIVMILTLTFLLSLVAPRSIFKLGIWSFTGFAGLLPILIAALFWKRSTAMGAYASVFTTAVAWLYFFNAGSKTIAGTDIMAVTVVILLSSVAMVVVSLFTRPPSNIDKFFPPG